MPLNSSEVMDVWRRYDVEKNRLCQIAYRKIRHHFGFLIRDGVEAAMNRRQPPSELRTTLRGRTLVCVGTCRSSSEKYVFTLGAPKLAMLRLQAKAFPEHLRD
jgi:hypothetical protein